MSDILKNIEWACDAIRNREKFGLDDLNAAYARERRAKGILISAKTEIKNLQKEIDRYKNLYGIALGIADGQIDEVDDLKSEIDVVKGKNFELENTTRRLLIIKEEHQKEIESLKAELAKERGKNEIN